ncbi:MAG TPA: hypothetical protein VFQ80_10180 [Thermomicrobiales bacterium]|nr:hypothetical protein [Thermomicrobiales bacterium]
MAIEHPLVGAWRVAVTVPAANATSVNLATLGGDGSVVVAFPSPTPAPANAGHRLEYWTTALGAWEPSSPRGGTMTFVSLGVDETGANIGAHMVTAQASVAADGRTWSGPFRIENHDANCVAIGAVEGTVLAERIAADGA